MVTGFTERVRRIIGCIPFGMVTTYGLIAEGAGNRCGARQVAGILHSSSTKYNLPWHRVINREGKISLPASGGYEMQRLLLEQEGVVFDENNRVVLEEHLWFP